MPFLQPNQQRQSTKSEGKIQLCKEEKTSSYWFSEAKEGSDKRQRDGDSEPEAKQSK